MRGAIRGCLTPVQFEAARRRHAAELRPVVLSALRRILVDGVYGQQAIDEHPDVGISRQYLQKLAKRFYAETVPEGWVSRPITAPKALMEEFERMAAAARRAWDEALAAGRRETS